MMNTATRKSRITETSIGGTVYIVEALQNETAYAKVKRLILNNADGPKKLSQSTHLLSELDSTSAK